MEGEIAPFDDTLVRRKPSYTMEDFLAGEKGPGDEDQNANVHDSTEDVDAKPLSVPTGIFGDPDKTPMLSKFADPFRSSPAKEESPNKVNSPLSTADKFKRLQALNNRMFTPELNEGGLNVDVLQAAKDQHQLLQEQRQLDLANASMESGPSLNLNVVMIDNRSSPQAQRVSETQIDNPIDLDLLVNRANKPQSVIGDELDFNNYTIHDESHSKGGVVLGSSDDEDGTVGLDDAMTTIPLATKESTSQRLVSNSQSQSLASPTEALMQAGTQNISEPSTQTLSQRGVSILGGLSQPTPTRPSAKHLSDIEESFTITKENDTSTQKEQKRDLELTADSDDEVIKIKRRNTYNVLDDSMGESSPTKRRVLKSRAGSEENLSSESVIQETYKIPETDESNSGFATQVIPSTQLVNNKNGADNCGKCSFNADIVDSSPRADQTEYEVPNTSAMSMGIPILGELNNTQDYIPISEDCKVVRKPMNASSSITDVLDDTCVFVNLDATEVMRIDNVFRKEDGYYLDVVASKGEEPVTVPAKKLFAPIFLDIGDAVRYHGDRKWPYYVTGLEKDSDNFLTTSNGFSKVYLKRKGSDHEISVHLKDIYLTANQKRDYSHKLFQDLDHFKQYMDSHHARFDARGIEDAITSVAKTSRPFSGCVFVLTGISTRPGTRSRNTSATNTPSRTHVVDRMDIDCSGITDYLESLGAHVLQDSGLETVVELTTGKTVSGQGIKYTPENLQVSAAFSHCKFACVLSTRHSRTMKYLQGVSLLWPAVHVDFVRDCMNFGDRMLDTWRDRILDYTLPSGDTDAGYVCGMNLSSWLRAWIAGDRLSSMVHLNTLFCGTKIGIVSNSLETNIECNQLVWLMLALGSDEVLVLNQGFRAQIPLKRGSSQTYTLYGTQTPNNNGKSLNWQQLVRHIVCHRL